MRKCFALVFLLLFSWIVGLRHDARAGVTIDVLFQDGTEGALTITAGEQGPGCAFGGYAGGSVGTGHCMNVVLRSTYDMVRLSTSVTYESDDGLAIGTMYEWRGPGVLFGRCGSVAQCSPLDGLANDVSVMCGPLVSCYPTDGLLDNGGVIERFDCTIPEPTNLPVLHAGTYRVGTIVWNTSGTTSGTEAIATVINDVIDGVAAVINGNVVLLDSTEITVDSAVLNIIPEAVAVPSMRATGVTVLGVAVFGIGIIGLVLASRRRFN